MKKYFKIFSIFFFLFLANALFADDWYICLGSFKEKVNAQSRERVLNENNIPSFVIQHTSRKGEKLYRVLLDEPLATERKAEIRKNELEQSINANKLGIKSLWYYQPYQSSLKKRVDPAPVAKPEPAKPVTKVENPKPVENPTTQEENKNVAKVEPVAAPEEPVANPVENTEPAAPLEPIVANPSNEVDSDISISSPVENLTDEVANEVSEPVLSIEEQEELKAVDVPLSDVKFIGEDSKDKKAILNEPSVKPEDLPKRKLLIKDSVTGHGIADANINIDNKWDTLTDNSGWAPIPNEVPDGTHEILVSKGDDYVPTKSTFNIVGDEITANSQISVPKAVDYNRIQIVLDWGYEPYDIDSHIICENHHVYFSNRYEDNMDLDRDDTDSYGPETITIRDIKADKKYEYYVFNYSHQELYGTSLSYSNARVRVIIQNEQVNEFNITPGMVGRTWHVFDIINGNEIVVFDELIEWKPEVENDYSGESSEWNDESETTAENVSENTEVSGDTVNSDSVYDSSSSVPSEISEEDKDNTDEVSDASDRLESAESVESATSSEVETHNEDSEVVDVITDKGDIDKEEIIIEEKESELEETSSVNPEDAIDVPSKIPYKETPEDLLEVYGRIE